MADGNFRRVRWLAFDVFGTVMDLTGSLSGPVGEFLRAQGAEMSGGRGEPIVTSTLDTSIGQSKLH